MLKEIEVIPEGSRFSSTVKALPNLNFKRISFTFLDIHYLTDKIHRRKLDLLL